MVGQLGPKNVGVIGFASIIVNLIPLDAFAGLNCGNGITSL